MAIRPSSRIGPSVIGAAFLLFATVAIAAGADDQAASTAHYGDQSDGIPACASCHGDNGQGQAAAGFPRLAGLPQSYLVRQLAHFANGQRQNAMMTPIAKLLSANQRESLAAYYAQLPPPTPRVKRHDANISAAVERLAHDGRWNEDLPGCTQCHGAGGLGVGEDFPPLAGQPAAYIVNQLHDWQQGKRPPGPLHLMSAVAGKLSDSDIQALAAYFSNRPTTAGKAQ